MNIVMLTNTYTPHVGGVARSVQAFSKEYGRRGHHVLVVAPEFDNQPLDDEDVVRVPAIRNFNGSDFSVALPNFGLLTNRLDAFAPDIIHAHHPYLLGMTAARIARNRELPLVFTHHTLYEQYTHYTPGDSSMLKHFVSELATRYANLTDQVFSPSESIMALLRERQVEAPIAVIPTGVQLENFAHGDGEAFREEMGIPQNVFVVGHLGRLAPEKNLHFLAEAVVAFLKTNEQAHFLLIGKGSSEDEICEMFSEQGLSSRFHKLGLLQSQQQLADAYSAMDVFAFASHSETQGMVLSEAMAAGTPVVALDASGVREVVQDGINGYLLQDENVQEFAKALQDIYLLPPDRLQQLKAGALRTAEEFSMSRSADKALEIYERLISQSFKNRHDEYVQLRRVLHLLKTEWDIIEGIAAAANTSLFQARSHME